MRFSRPQRRPHAESVVPMINVVFLLLIFFMMSATISPAPPFDLSLPATDAADELVGDTALYLSADGKVGYRGLLNDAAWGALEREVVAGPLTIRADATLEAATLAKIIARLSQSGRNEIELAIRAP